MQFETFIKRIKKLIKHSAIKIVDIEDAVSSQVWCVRAEFKCDDFKASYTFYPDFILVWASVCTSEIKVEEEVEEPKELTSYGGLNAFCLIDVAKQVIINKLLNKVIELNNVTLDLTYQPGIE